MTQQERYDDAMFDFSQANYDSTIAKLTALLAENPEYFDAQLSLGVAYYRKGDFATAIAEGHKAEKLRPKEQLVHTNLSLFYMKAGDKVMSVLPSCNYDEEVWPNPLDVDFDRVRKPILSFAGGVHSCMGAHLARMEIRIGLEEWLKRIPDFSVKPGTVIEYRPGGVVGPEYLPLEW